MCKRYIIFHIPFFFLELITKKYICIFLGLLVKKMGVIKKYIKCSNKKYKSLVNAAPLQLRDDGKYDTRSTVSMRKIDVSGEEIIKHFDQLIETGFQHKPHIFQRELFHAVLNAIAPDLIGESGWERDGEKICNARKWTFISKMVLAMAPRRFGKSEVIGMVMAARVDTIFKYSDRNDRQAVFSIGERASSELKKYAIECLIELGWADHITKSSGEEVIVKKYPGVKGSPEARLYFYPSNPEISIIFFLFFFFSLFWKF